MKLSYKEADRWRKRFALFPTHVEGYNQEQDEWEDQTIWLETYYIRYVDGRHIDGGIAYSRKEKFSKAKHHIYNSKDRLR